MASNGTARHAFPLEQAEWNAFTVRNLASACVLAVALSKVLQLLQRLFLSPLNDIPGSFAHRISSWPLKLAVTRGTSHHFTLAQHRQHGPLAVLAPNMIAVSDAHEINRIIHTEDWPKSEAVYHNFRQDPDRPTLIAYTDKKAYARRKRLVSSMFGLRYIRGMQPLMQGCIARLTEALDARCTASGSGVARVDMQHLIQSLAVDIIGITTFGQHFHVVETGSHPLPERLKQALKLSGLLQFMPWIRRIPFLPQRDPYVDSFTAEIVDARRRQQQQPESETPHDLLQKLVEAAHDGPGSEFRRSDVQDEAVVMLAAGSETTANAELFTLLMLVKHPDKLERVYREIDAWYPDDQRPTDCAYSLTGMKYLQACIDEAMRLIPGQATGSPRQSPADTTILGHRVPQGTTVFPVTQQAQQDERWWAQATEYIPERWLESPDTKAYWPFSAGSRVCIGKHFALQEMHLTLVSLLRRFRVVYVPGQDETTVFRVAQQMRASHFWMEVAQR